MLSRSSRTLRLLSRAGRQAAARLTRELRPAPASYARPCEVEPLEDRRLLTVTLASVSMAGAAGNGNSGESSISENGRFVVFSSTASDLVPNDTNNASDIFRYDLVNHTIELVSVRPDGAPGTGGSFEPSISADGRFVGFRSEAPDITNNDGQVSSDVFLRDMQTGVTRLVSVSGAAGAIPNTPGNGESRETFVSANGRYVAFSSFATNLVDGDANGRTDAFVRDMDTGRTVAVSLDSTGAATGNERSLDPAVAVGADGRVFVSFRSFASNLVSNDANGKVDVFRRVLNGDLTGGQTALVSVNTGGGSGNGDSTSNSISSNGRFVVFSSTSSDLAGGDANNNADVFLRDMDAGTTRLLSTNRQGTASANGASGEPSVSTDGNFAAYTSTASNIVDGDTNNQDDIFFVNLATGVTKLLSTNAANAPGNGRSFDPFVSANGNFVAFTSSASDLANGAGAFDDVFAASTGSIEQGPGNPPPSGGGGDPTPPPVEQGAAPTFALSPFNVPPTTGAADYTFRMNYEDVSSGVNRNALGNLEVVTPTGAVLPATFVKVAGIGNKVRATYRISAPNGTWSAADNGNYTVRATASAVQDGVGNAVAAGTTLGTLAVAVAPPESANLNGTMAASLPPSLIAGGKAKAKVSLSLLNQGQTAINGPVTTQLFVSADDDIDEDDVQIGSATTKLKLSNNGKAKKVNFKLNFPANIVDDTYHILARIDSGNGVVETNEFDNIVVSQNTVVVAKPFVELESSAPQLVAKTLTSGAKATGSVTLKNNGNSPAKGSINIDVIGRNGAGQDVALGTATAKANIKNGATKITKFKLTLAGGVTPGNYTLVLKVDPANVLGDTNLTNNTVVGNTIAIS